MTLECSIDRCKVHPAPADQIIDTPDLLPSEDSEVLTEEERPHRTWGKYLVVSIEQWIILFGFYVLSIGPMYWTWVNARESGGFSLVEIFYRPLYYLSIAFPPLADWLNWYVRWWIF